MFPCESMYTNFIFPHRSEPKCTKTYESEIGYANILYIG